jgi:hypothetical protein
MIVDDAVQSQQPEAAEPKPKRLARLVAHNIVPGLCAQLYRQRFQSDLEWGQGDGAVLSRVLGMNPSWTMDELEAMIRAYYASDNIRYGEQPSEWLPTLSKYRHGPLDSQGTPKAELARIDAEVARQNAEISAAEDRRQAEARSRDKQAILDRAIASVGRDLLAKGYEVFRPLGPSTCHLIATSQPHSRTVHALRIRVVPGASEPSGKSHCYEALIPEETDFNPLNSSRPTLTTPIHYAPPLIGDVSNRSAQAMTPETGHE